MDLQKIISDLVSKLSGNNDLIGKFTSDPLSLIKDLLGIDLDAGQLGDVIKGVTEKLGLSGDLLNGVKDKLDDVAGDVAKEGPGLLDKIKGLFGGK